MTALIGRPRRLVAESSAAGATSLHRRRGQRRWRTPVGRRRGRGFASQNLVEYVTSVAAFECCERRDHLQRSLAKILQALGRWNNEYDRRAVVVRWAFVDEQFRPRIGTGVPA